MKKIIPLMLLFLIAMPLSAFAQTSIDLTSSFYVHANQVGTYNLRGATGSKMYGDANEHDAVIANVTFNKQGMAPGDRLYLVYPDGTEKTVEGDYIYISDNRPENVEIKLKKTTNAETLIYVTKEVVDDVDSPEYIVYNYSPPPVTFGSLGSGSDTGSGGTTPDQSNDGVAVDHKLIYQDYNDYYRLDYFNKPSGTSKVRIVYTSPTNVKHEREWGVDQTGGTLYLTGKGSYDVQFLDSTGKQIGYIHDLDTNGIQQPLNQSFPEPVPRNDLDASIEGSACEKDDPNAQNTVKWTPKPGADSYDIYKDGQKIDNVKDTQYTLPSPGSYSVVARDPSGNPIAQSDINTPYVTGESQNGDALAICKCIEDLKPVLGEIATNTGAIKIELDGTNQRLDQVNDNLGEIIRQITPTKTYPIPSPVSKPDLFKPDDVAPQKYVNTHSYFEDEGSAPAPDAMPAAPEPKDWVDGNGKILQPTETLQKEPELVQEVPLTMDQNMQTDQPMQTQQPMQTDQPMQSDPQQTKEPDLQRDQPLQVQENNFPLRWQSVPIESEVRR